MISAASILNVWERGATQSSVRRALVLLSLMQPDAAPDALLSMTLGERDALLLALRERLFGSCLDGVATCPHCGERLEMAFEASDLRVTNPSQPASDRRVTGAGATLTCRLITSADLLAVETLQDAAEARRLLVQRCVIAPDGMDLQPLTDDVVNDVAERMRQMDAQADVQLAMTCPACAHEWSLPFDIASYLWRELNDWALRLLREVHTLARAYGWREADILAMSARRRALYLQLLGG